MVNDVYQEFLRATGFEGHELSEYLPQWREASIRLGLTEDDISFSLYEQLPTYFELEMEGIRKLLGCFVKEAIDLTKANAYKQRGVKIVYGILPAILHYYYALKLTAPDRVYVGFPDMFLTQIMNIFFHKLNPYLEEAERSGIGYGCRHCALNKVRYIARKWEIIPSPDVNWIWGFICDEGPKTDEFIRMHLDPQWKTYITRLPHDQPLGTIEDEVVERVEYLASQMKDGFEFVQKEIGIRVTDDKIHEVISIWRNYAKKLNRLYQLMVADPQPISGLSTVLFGAPLSRPFNTGVDSMEKALDILTAELEERVANKKGILSAGAPKLMVYLIPNCVPWVMKIFEENGIALGTGSMGVLTKKELQPSAYEDPYMIAAETWLRRGSHVNIGYEAEQICEKAILSKCDGILFGFLDFDRQLGSSHRLLARIVEDKTKLPVFYIEGDAWEDRDYGPEALRTRIESIAEILKMRKYSA
ncbi:2-hydroxyacyl-CoA dehydratase [Chloroflexota bacterium]